MSNTVIPSRDNAARTCIVTDEQPDRDLPDHIRPCGCDEHHGVCMTCNFKITVGQSGIEYGHARATNRSPNMPGKRRDCPHRPPSVDPSNNRSPNGGTA